MNKNRETMMSTHHLLTFGSIYVCVMHDALMKLKL